MLIQNEITVIMKKNNYYENSIIKSGGTAVSYKRNHII